MAVHQSDGSPVHGTWQRRSDIQVALRLRDASCEPILISSTAVTRTMSGVVVTAPGQAEKRDVDGLMRDACAAT